MDMDLMDYQLPREASIPLPASEVMGHHHHGAMGAISTMPPMPMPEAAVTPKQILPSEVSINLTEVGLPRRRPGMENLGENFERGKGREGEPLDNAIPMAKRPDPIVANNHGHYLGHEYEHHDNQMAGHSVLMGQPKSQNSKYSTITTHMTVTKFVPINLCFLF